MDRKASAGKLSGWFTRIVSSSGIPLALFFSLLALTLTYRIMLTVGLFTNPIRPFDFSPGSHPIRFTLAYWSWPPCSRSWPVPSFFGFSLGENISSRKENIFLFQIVGLIFSNLVLFGLLFAHLGHLRVLFNVRPGSIIR